MKRKKKLLGIKSRLSKNENRDIQRGEIIQNIV